MSTPDIFRDKKILLHAPDDVSEIIYCARYIPIISKTALSVSLILPDSNGLGQLIKSTLCNVAVFPQNTTPPFQHDIELDLNKLPLMFIDERNLVPTIFLHPPSGPLAKFNSIMKNTGMLNIGLALYGCPDNTQINSTTISQNITMKQRHSTKFFFIPAESNQTESPPFSNFENTTEMVQNYCDLAALLASLDVIISFENDVAHIAAALGKPVWLLIADSHTNNLQHSWCKFPNVTIFRRPHSGSWQEVIRAISLFRFIQPEKNVFTPFSTKNFTLDKPAALPFPTISVENTGQLVKLLDAELAVFTTVSIETTTVCNLKCPYCPNSTDVAKPPTFMPDEMFFRIIDSLHEYVPSYSGNITPSMYGEPLLDKRLESFIKYAKSRFPLAHIELFTNGDFLTPERFLALREAGVGQYNISQHTPEMSPTLLKTLTTVERELAEELPVRINRMLVQNKFNRGGLVEVEGLPPEQCVLQIGCLAAYKNISFDYNGDAILCCNDYQAVHKFGNIASKSVKEIWDDVKYRRVRNMSMLGFLPFKICRTCLSH